MRLIITPDEATIIVQNYIALKYKIPIPDVNPFENQNGKTEYIFNLPLNYGDGGNE